MKWAGIREIRKELNQKNDNNLGYGKNAEGTKEGIASNDNYWSPFFHFWFRYMG